jgi:ketosteroid isomerase-like protein
MKSYWHPKYVGWDYAQALPMNYDAFLKVEEDFYMNYKFKKLEIDPLEIQVEGNLAIIHLNYDDVFSDSIGKEISASGRWTTIMLKQDKKWVIMSSVWIEK